MKCKHCQADLADGIKFCGACGKSVDESTVKTVDTIKAAMQEVVGGLKSQIDTSIKAIDERLKSIEGSAVRSINVNTRVSSHYKGFNLGNQMANARNIASANPKMFPFMSNDEKVEDMSKMMIALARAKRFNDQGAFADIKAIQMKYAELSENQKVKAAMQEGTDSEGGYLVPDEYSFDLVKLARNKSFALSLCTVLNMGSDTLKVPAEASLVTVAWTAEETAATQAEPTFGQVELIAKKLDGYAIVSNEMLQDSMVDVAGLLNDQYGLAIALELDNQVLNGTGAVVSGLLTAACGYSVIMGTGLSNFSSITADNLSALIDAIGEGEEDGATFIFNKKIMHFIRTLKTSTNDYIYAKPGNGVPGTIWEYPYFISSKAPRTTGASTAFVTFGNMKNFYIGRRIGTMSIDVDPYGKFVENQTRFRVVTRWGMKIAKASAFARLITAS